jgi:hypothetical protein
MDDLQTFDDRLAVEFDFGTAQWPALLARPFILALSTKVNCWLQINKQINKTTRRMDYL